MSQTAGDRADQLALSEAKLNSHYRRLLLAIALPLFVIVLALTFNQYLSERDSVLKELEYSTDTLGIALDSVTELALDHIIKMQSAMQDCLAHSDHSAHRLIPYFQPVTNSKTPILTLDALPESQQKLAGQMVYLGSDEAIRSQPMPNCMLELFNVVRLDHQVTPYFRWSYFMSESQHLVGIFPWLSSGDLSVGQGFDTVQAAIQSWFQYDVLTGVMPAADPQKQVHWTAPYFDVIGAGAMVSLGAPVYVQEQFVGGVGTDVRLATLQEFLRTLPRIAGRLLIVDEQGMALADTAAVPANSIRLLSEVMPDLPQVTALSVNSGVKKLSTDEAVVLLRRSLNAPWALLFRVEHKDVVGLLLPRLLPYGVILSVLALTCAFALYRLRRELIDPALSLVNYIQRVAANPSTRKPALPALWNVWADVISMTVEENVRAHRNLYRSEERLQQILNNSSALICVRDGDGRFVSVNQSFQSVLALPPESIIGKSLDQVFPPLTAQSMERADRQVLKDRTAQEFEEMITLEDGEHTYLSNKFPLYDASGEVYAICSVSTDITREKRSQAVMREAAFGVSQAKGEEVFDVLVTHLSAAVGTHLALIGVLDSSQTHIHTRALCSDGKISENIVYSTDDSPCIQVANEGYRCFSSQLTQCFPGCSVVQSFGFESYAGVPLVSSNGETLGILAVLDHYSLPDTALLESVLKVFSARAVAELERERSDAAMRASEASYRSIFEASESAILVHDMESWEILDVNPKACELYGYTRSEMQKISIGELSSGEAPYTMQDAMALLTRAAAGERLRFEWRRRDRHGRLGWNEVFLRRARLGGDDRILAITNDISARKETEAKLRSSEEQTRQANIRLQESEAFKSAIVDNALLAVVTVDESGRVVEFNPAATRMFGYDHDAALGAQLSTLIVPETQRQAHAEALQRYQVQGMLPLIGKRLQWTAMNSSGGEFPVELSVSLNKRGDASFFTAFISDLTELKGAEEELGRQREALRQSEKLSAMGALLAGVAHELNNPLAILMGRSALLQSKLEDTVLQGDVAKINAAAERCARIVRTFLAMARQRPTQREGCQLNDVITAALDLLGYSLRAGGIELHVDLAADLPEVDMDADQIGQVVLNLIVNAQQALEQEADARRIQVQTFENNSWLCLRVADNGAGIPERVRERIFDPFFTTKAEGVGTGVGLSVSRGIVREHQGEMLLENTDRLTSFLVRLPIAPAKLNEFNPVQPELNDGAVRTALIVDDEAEVAELLGEILQSAGFKTAEFVSGQSALEWLQQHPCDFILSDIRMPDMDGIALWRHLKQFHPKLASRMAFVTGDTLSSSVAPFLQETGLPGLEKPFTPESVLTLVAKLEACE